MQDRFQSSVVGLMSTRDGLPASVPKSGSLLMYSEQTYAVRALRRDVRERIAILSIWAGFGYEKLKENLTRDTSDLITTHYPISQIQIIEIVMSELDTFPEWFDTNRRLVLEVYAAGPQFSWTRSVLDHVKSEEIDRTRAEKLKRKIERFDGFDQVMKGRKDNLYMGRQGVGKMG